MTKRIQGKRWAVIAFDTADRVTATMLCRFELWARLVGCEHARAGVVAVDAAEARAMVRAGVPMDETTMAHLCALAACSRYTAKAAIRACISRGRGNLAHAESVGTDRSSARSRPKGVQTVRSAGHEQGVRGHSERVNDMKRVEVEITPKTAADLDAIKLAATQGPMSDADALTFAAKILAAFLRGVANKGLPTVERDALLLVFHMLGLHRDLPTKQ